MAISNPSITLELDHYAIATGTSVTLTVRLSEKFQDLQDEGVRLEFNDGPGPGGKFEGLHPDGKVVTITWRAPNLGNGKKFVLTAKLRKAGTDLDTDAKEVSVLRNPSIEIDSIEPDKTPEGGLIRLKTSVRNQTPATLRDLNVKVSWPDTRNGVFTSDAANPLLATWDTTGLAPGTYPARAQLVDRADNPIRNDDGNTLEATTDAEVQVRPLSRGDVLPVTLRRSTALRTGDQILWSLIRERTGALSFTGGGYKLFVDKVLCDPDSATNSRVHDRLAPRVKELGTHSYGMAAYELLKMATEVYLLIECGVALDKSFDRAGFDVNSETARLGERISVTELRNRLNRYFHSGRLPYLDRVVEAVFPDGRTDVDSIFCPGALSSRVTAPCLLELIWSYWHEEGMLVQTMNAVARRFQNVRAPGVAIRSRIVRSIHCGRSTISCGATSRTSKTG